MLRKGIVLFSLALALALGACSVKTTSSPPSQTNDGGTPKPGAKAKPKTTPKTASLKSRAGSTPPAGATSKGTMSSPKVGALTVPIQEVEVYVFAFDYDDSGTQDEIYWAHVDATTYLWTAGPVECSDGTVDPSGAFLMAVQGDGSGTYMFSLGGCPSSDLFGCDFDAGGNETACGVCQVEGEDLACVASSEG